MSIIMKDICLTILKGILFSLLLTVCLNSTVHSQNITKSGDTIQPTDLTDVLKKLFKVKIDTLKPIKKSSIAILPTLSYNPSFGFVFGAKVSAGTQLGDPSNTSYSIIGLEGFITTKGIISAQARHNIFTPGDKWNWQGHWQLSKYGIIDYGIGTGAGSYRGRGFIINEYPTVNSDSAFPIKYSYIRLFEKVYRKIGSKLFAGAGIGFDFHYKIDDQKLATQFSTPHKRYSVRNGFDTLKYATNGILLALQYNTREHPIRSYGGMYADMSLRFNEEWLGSTIRSTQLAFDIRKYWSLSKKNPEHVLAFWHWSTFLLGGKVPYLELPATGYDTYARSGRGYTIGRFKGPNYFYLESEYRFPITRNKLLAGVLFVNTQSASDDINKDLFDYWDMGYGAGLRILFQKKSRTTLCVDFAKGNYGSNGIFFGLNEVF